MKIVEVDRAKYNLDAFDWFQKVDKELFTEKEAWIIWLQKTIALGDTGMITVPIKFPSKEARDKFWDEEITSSAK